MQSIASLSVRLEVGGGLGRDKALTRPADILVSNPSGSASAAYDITVTSPLNPSIILEAGVSAGTAAKAAEVRKHSKYDVKCSELGWRCTPLAVETYGAWGTEARDTFSFMELGLPAINGANRAGNVHTTMNQRWTRRRLL